MSSNLIAKIEITKNENAEIVVSILNCNLNFEGSQITFNKDFEIDSLDIPADTIGRIAIGFDNPYIDRKLNIAAEDIILLRLIGCEIQNKHPKLDIDFRGRSLSIDKCTTGTDNFEFNFKHENLKLSNLRNGFLEIDQNLKIISKKITIAFPQGLTLKSDSGEFVFSPEYTLRIIQGKFLKIQISRPDIHIITEKRASINLLQAPNYEFNDIKCNLNGYIEIGPSTLILRSIDSSSKIIIKNTRLEKFTCDTYDFSATIVNFLGNSSINFKEFESIATIWNPMLITYRGFNPTEFKNIPSEANIPAAREFFCEMKTYFSGRGDSITAGDFHTTEMIAHRRYLQLKKDSSSSDRFDRFIMLASHISSNFGQSALRALLWYLALGLLFTIILILLMGDMCARCLTDWNVLHSFECNFFWILLLNVLSPLNLKLTDVIPIGAGLSPNSASAMFLWMLWKIIGGFLIFQIITSSRRFIRKW